MGIHTPGLAENKNMSLSIEQVQEKLFQIDERYKKPFDGELTYDDHGRNTVFFSKEDFPLSNEIVSAKEEKIHADREFLEKVKTEIKENPNFSTHLQNLYLAAIAAKQAKLKMFEAAVWLEAEKSGLPLDAQLRQEKQSKVQNLQRIIYGKPASEDPEEVGDTFEVLQSLFEKKSNILSDKERQEFSDFLSLFSEILNPQKRDKKTPVPQATVAQGEKTIDRDTFKSITVKILGFYKSYFNSDEIQKWKIQDKQGGGSLNINGVDRVLNIPQKYATTNHNKLTQTVIGHEIEQHLLQRVNSNPIAGTGFSASGYDFIAEGVAKLNEDIANGKLEKFEDLPLLKEGNSIVLTGILICELLPFNQAVRIATLYYKMKGKDQSEAEDNAKTLVLRRKRFVARDLPGSSMKDALYKRGKNWVIDYLMEGGDLQGAIERYKNLNVLKVGPEELHFVGQLKSEGVVKEEELALPLFLGRILADKLTHGKGSLNRYKEFSYMKLNQKDITYNTKRQLVEILQALRGS